MSDLSEYRNGVGIQASLLPLSLLHTEENTSADLLSLFSHPEYIAFYENREKIRKEINHRALLFTNERITTINSLGPIQIAMIDTFDVVNYKHLFDTIQQDLSSQIDALSKQALEEKESKRVERAKKLGREIEVYNKPIKIDKKALLQKDLLQSYELLLSLFYKDYMIRACNERSHYPSLTKGVKDYDRIWSQSNFESVSVAKMKIKSKGLKPMREYGYDEKFFKENDFLYEQFLAKQ